MSKFEMSAHEVSSTPAQLHPSDVASARTDLTAELSDAELETIAGGKGSFNGGGRGPGPRPRPRPWPRRR